MKIERNFIKWIFGMLGFLILTHIAFSIPAPVKWLESIWDAGDLIAFVGTITLGYVAWWQNDNANKLNKDMLNMQIKTSCTPYFILNRILITSDFKVNNDEMNMEEIEIFQQFNDDGTAREVMQYFETVGGVWRCTNFICETDRFSALIRFKFKNIGEGIAKNLKFSCPECFDDIEGFPVNNVEKDSEYEYNLIIKKDPEQLQNAIEIIENKIKISYKNIYNFSYEQVFTIHVSVSYDNKAMFVIYEEEEDETTNAK